MEDILFGPPNFISCLFVLWTFACLIWGSATVVSRDKFPLLKGRKIQFFVSIVIAILGVGMISSTPETRLNKKARHQLIHLIETWQSGNFHTVADWLTETTVRDWEIHHEITSEP